jgi:hypothetical protein
MLLVRRRIAAGSCIVGRLHSAMPLISLSDPKRSTSRSAMRLSRPDRRRKLTAARMGLMRFNGSDPLTLPTGSSALQPLTCMRRTRVSGLAPRSAVALAHCRVGSGTLGQADV